MSSRYRILPTSAWFVLCSLIPAVLAAQSAEDVLRYSHEYPTYDAISLVMPGVTHASGFGSYQENPAVMGLFDYSFSSISLSFRNVSEETTFQNRRYVFDNSEYNTGDIGLVYKIPTLQGSFVVGGGYSQTTDFNRAMGIDIRNNRSTLTDDYNTTPDEDLYDAAFNVYMVDWADNDSTFTESIFRIGFNPEQFPGVNQDMELTERGRMGEYSVFFSTEFLRNLHIGGSFGVIAGNYKYERQFLESDPNNFYDGTLIDSDNDGVGDTDIESVLSIDTIDAEFVGFSARAGILYSVGSILNVGGSYEFPSTLSFSEKYNTRLSSTFDNGPGFVEELPGEYSYKIKRPARIKVGISLENLAGITLTGSVEQVDYTTAELDLEGVDIEYQNTENEFIESEFKVVRNYSGGLELTLIERFVPRFGYTYQPSPRKSFDATRQFFNAGFSAKMADNLWFDVGAQYAIWDDENRLYTYDDGTNFVDETAEERVVRLHVMGGLRIEF